MTALVLAGALRPGARLPSIRQLADDLGLAGGTVARAYRELEADGIVATRGRHGTVVAGAPRAPATAGRAPHSGPAPLRPTRRRAPVPGSTTRSPPCGSRSRCRRTA